MSKSQRLVIISWLLVFCIVNIFPVLVPASPFAGLPQTGTRSGGDASSEGNKGGGGKSAVRVAVDGVFSYPVVQSGSKVPNQGGVLGQYSVAKNKNNIGLLGHNYLSGGAFFALAPGMHVTVQLSNGKTQTYEIYNVLRFKATDPNDFSKPFLDMSGKEYKAKQVFRMGYRKGQLTFQTCITAEGSSTWGVMFIQAKPIKGN